MLLGPNTGTPSKQWWVICELSERKHCAFVKIVPLGLCLEQSGPKDLAQAGALA